MADPVFTEPVTVFVNTKGIYRTTWQYVIIVGRNPTSEFISRFGMSPEDMGCVSASYPYWEKMVALYRDLYSQAQWYRNARMNTWVKFPGHGWWSTDNVFQKEISG